MTAARSAGKASTGEAKEDSAGRSKVGAQETPFWEKMVGVLGLLLVLGVVGVLLYEGFQPQTAAEIVTEVKSITPQAGGYLVEFQASNRGRKTAAAVVIEGALYEPGSGEAAEPLETAEITFDYIPDQSDRLGAFLFERDPRQYELRLQAKGFMDP